MPTLWRVVDHAWQPTSPSGFPDERTLHDLVEAAPNMLPIAGAPRLTIIGKETPLGAGYADLLAIESDGRPVVIEIKLSRNSEAKRAVVAQVLSYAAALYGMSPDQLHAVCSRYLSMHRLESIADAVERENQAGAFDRATFDSSLATYLAEGRFRIVVVLDDAPPDLRTLARYLAAVGDRLIVDIISVQQFEIGSEVVIVPEHIDLDRPAEQASRISPKDSAEGQLLPGVSPFLEAVAQLSADARTRIDPVVAWAERLEVDGLVTLDTFLGKSQITLLPRLRDEHVGLVTVWATGAMTLSAWRSVFERRAPHALVALEARAERIGQGTSLTASAEILAILRSAYEEATGVATE